MKNGWRIAILSVGITLALVGFIYVSLDKRVMAIETENKAIRDCMGEIKVSIAEIKTDSRNLKDLLIDLKNELKFMRTGRNE